MTEKKVARADEWRKLRPSNRTSDDKKEAFKISPELRETLNQALTKQAKEITDCLAPQIEQANKQICRMLLPLRCDSLRGEYNKHKNDSLYAIEAFLLCHEEGIEPPAWVMRCLAEKLGEFYKSEGTKSLDRLFGFGRSRGKRFKKRALEKRNFDLCSDVYKLKTFFGLSDEQASLIVASQPNLSGKTLLDIFKKWKRGLNPENSSYLTEKFTKIPTEDRIDYLRTFRDAYSEGHCPPHLNHFFEK